LLQAFVGDDEDVGLGAGQAMGPAEVLEHILELGSGEAMMAFGEVRSQQPRAGVGRPGGADASVGRDVA
jgi:hypothetical protein